MGVHVIRVLPDDKAAVSMTPHDLKRARIVFRAKRSRGFGLGRDKRVLGE